MEMMRKEVNHRTSNFGYDVDYQGSNGEEDVKEYDDVRKDDYDDAQLMNDAGQNAAAVAVGDCRVYYYCYYYYCYYYYCVNGQYSSGPLLNLSVKGH